MNSNFIASILCKLDKEKFSFLDSKNILWKWINDEWIGKRSVYTFDCKASWLEDVKEEEVRSWWCEGKHADYNEIFIKTKILDIKTTEEIKNETKILSRTSCK